MLCFGMDDEPAKSLSVNMTRQTTTGAMHGCYRPSDQDTLIIDKLTKHGIGKWEVRWAAKWLNSQPLMVISMNPCWRPLH